MLETYENIEELEKFEEFEEKLGLQEKAYKVVKI